MVKPTGAGKRWRRDFGISDPYRACGAHTQEFPQQSARARAFDCDTGGGRYDVGDPLHPLGAAFGFVLLPRSFPG